MINKVIIYYLNWEKARNENGYKFSDAISGTLCTPLEAGLYSSVLERLGVFLGDAEEVADRLFAEFNNDDRARNIRSMSVGDIVVCEDNSGEKIALLCARVGWTHLEPRWAHKLANKKEPGFLKSLCFFKE